MNFSIQNILETEQIILIPLQERDFEELYQVASDPKVWEQHPNKDRWKRDIFRVFVDGALQSQGAFKIIEKSTGKIIGSTRFYDYNKDDSSILIGYTFYGTAYWGKGYNQSVKKLMLNYIFEYVDTVFFHIGSENTRSQIAISRLGAEKIGEEEIPYFGEAPKLNFVYRIEKKFWLNLKAS